MIDKKTVEIFFDECAPTWDAHLVTDDRIIGIILDNCRVCTGKRVLDVACGTGVMIPYYMERKVSAVVGIDISQRMIEIAEEKYAGDNISFFRMDAESDLPEGLFDVINIYNAFPHFSDTDRLISNLCRALAPGGVLSVAHGMSRSRLLQHHSGRAEKISNILPAAQELAEMFSTLLKVNVIVDNDEMYQVCGIKNRTVR